MDEFGPEESVVAWRWSHSATVYDQDNPDSYHPPQLERFYFDEPAEPEVAPPEPQPSRRERVYKFLGASAVVGGIFGMGTALAFGVHHGREVVRSMESCLDLDDQVNADANSSLTEYRQQVANMEFGLDQIAFYDYYEPALKEARSVEEVESVLNEAFAHLGIQAHLNQLPPESDFRFNPAEFELEIGRGTAEALIKLLGNVPRGLLEPIRGYHIYLANGIHLYGEGKGGFVEGQNIGIGASPTEAAEVFYHELQHALLNETCGRFGLPDNLKVFDGVNPPGLTYGYDLTDEQRDEFVSKYWVATHYGADNPEEDLAELARPLMTGKYFELAEHPVLRDKMERLIAFHEQFEPGIRNYYRYLGWLLHRDFPQMTAEYALQDGSLTATNECTDRPTTMMLESEELNIRVAYDLLIQKQVPGTAVTVQPLESIYAITYGWHDKTGRLDLRPRIRQQILDSLQRSSLIDKLSLLTLTPNSEVLMDIRQLPDIGEGATFCETFYVIESPLVTAPKPTMLG